MNKKRIETDSIGPKKIDAIRLWGAQTQRSLENFIIGKEIMPNEIIVARCSFINWSPELVGITIQRKPRLVDGAAGVPIDNGFKFTKSLIISPGEPG